MMDDILGLSPGPKTDDVKRIKNLIRNHRNVPEDVVIMVSELRCHEDGCPDVETVLALLKDGAEPEKFKIAKPMQEVMVDDISDLLPL